MKPERLKWERALEGPFIKPCPGTVAPNAVTTPDIVSQNGLIDVYIGAVDGNRERIVHMGLSLDDFTSTRSIAVPASATLILNAGPADFDCFHVFDPAAIQLQDKIYLYYSAIGKAEDSIGVAISDNGKNFQKRESALLKGRSPEAVIKDGIVHLFYVLHERSSGYSIFEAISQDGVSFKPVSGDPVLSTGNPGQWDEMEVTTPRIIMIDNMYYMIFAGLNKNDERDIPRAFGLARSMDLLNWEKYPLNPVFQIGKQGAWDDGAIWFGTPVCMDDDLYLLYEGGRLENILGRTPALTQVGLARVPMKTFRELMANWK